MSGSCIHAVMSVSLRGGDDMPYSQKALTGPNNSGHLRKVIEKVARQQLQNNL